MIKLLLFLLSSIFIWSGVSAQTDVNEQLKQLQIGNDLEIRKQMERDTLPKFVPGVQMKELEKNKSSIPVKPEIKQNVSNVQQENFDSNCWYVYSITISTDIIKEEELAYFNKKNNYKYANKCITVEKILSIINDSNKHLQQLGYSNYQVLLPEQDINSKKLWFRIIEGSNNEYSKNMIFQLIGGKLKESDNSKVKNCQNIQNIEVSGIEKVDRDDVNIVVNKYNNKCLNGDDIGNILTDVNNYLLQKGFTTSRALLPKQDLSSGKLIIIVGMGHVEKVIQVGSGNKLNLNTIAKTLEGEILNIRDIEQMLEQYNRISSNSVVMDIKPGTNVGGSIVEIENKVTGQYFNFSSSLDNKGSKSTGENRFGLTATINDLFGVNDSIVIGARLPIDSPKGNESNNYNLLMRVPFLKNTITLNTDVSKYRSTIYLISGNTIISNGISQNLNLSLNHLLFRSASSRLSDTFGISVSDSKNYLAGQLLTSSSKRLSKFTNELTFDTVINGGSFNANLKYSKGIKAFNSVEDKNNITDVDPHAQFDKVQLDMSYKKQGEIFGTKFNNSTTISIQTADKGLYGLDQISVGAGVTRGFSRIAFAGERGVNITNDTTFPFEVSSSITGSLTFGIDIGKVESNSENSWNNEILIGSGLGLRLSSRSGVNLDFTVGKPIQYPNLGVETGEVVQFSIGYLF